MIERMFANEREVLPKNFESMVPGPVLAAFLSVLDRSRLNGHDLVRVIIARERQVAHEQAEVMADMAELAHCPPGLADSGPDRSFEEFESTSDELRAALRLTRRAAEFRVELAMRLRKRLPLVWESLLAGEIDLHRARTIVEETNHLSEETARVAVNRIIGSAPELTTGQLSARLRRLCLELEPAEVEERFRSAVDDRRVLIQSTVDGTADLHAYGLPLVRAAAIGSRLNAYAMSAKSADDDRTMDQRRADVLADLLEGVDTEGSSTRVGTVDIRVDLATLTGLAETSGELGGYGPVVADLARQVAIDQVDGE